MNIDDSFAVRENLVPIEAESLQDPEVKTFEEEVGLLHDQLMAAPSSAIPIRHVRANLEAMRQERR